MLFYPCSATRPGRHRRLPSRGVLVVVVVFVSAAVPLLLITGGMPAADALAAVAAVAAFAVGFTYQVLALTVGGRAAAVSADAWPLNLR